MKKLLLIAAVIALIISFAAACSNKKNTPADNEPAQSQLSDSALSDTSSGSAQSDPQSSDTAASQEANSDDTTQSSEADEQEQLNGSWQLKTQKRTYTYTFNSKTGKCMYARDGKALLCSYSLENDVLSLSNGKEFKLKLMGNILSLTNTETQKESHLARLQQESDLRKADFVGSWSCTIESDEDGSSVSLGFALNDDGTCTVNANDSEDSDSISATWQLKKGFLILDNGTQKGSGKLKYKVLHVDEEILTIDIEGFAVNLIHAN